jgi:hypothetical protein
MEALPSSLLRDLRYASVRPAVREPLIQAHVATQPAAPEQLDMTEEEVAIAAKRRVERERRERALAERERQVQDEQARQRKFLAYSKSLLREGEEEVQKAMSLGKGTSSSRPSDYGNAHEPLAD